MPRAILHVVHAHESDQWQLEQNGQLLSRFDTKQRAEEEGARRSAELHCRGLSAQMIVHRRDGSIENEYAFGHDLQLAI